MTDRIFAVDLGATWLRTAVVCLETLRVDMKSVVLTPDSAGAARQKIETDWQLAGRPRAVAFATAPELQPDGVVRRWPNRPNFEAENLLSSAIKENGDIAFFDDATAAAISAHSFDGKGRWKTTLCISIGTGIGGGAIIADVPLTGRTGAAMDVGHMLVPSASGLPCSCGRCGCLQAAASGFAFRKLLPSARSPDDIFQEAGSGAAMTLARATSAIIEALAILGSLFDPERVSIAGGLGLSQLFERIEIELKNRQVGVSIERHKFGEDAGLLGAAIGFYRYRRNDYGAQASEDSRYQFDEGIT
nr:ROK family protein [Bradyrhizobium diazoefficiens]